jgi:ketosteroid isomerase-like protein
MKRKITYRFLFVLSIAIFHLTTGALRAQAPVSTDSLVHQFHDAWNAEDIGRMVSLLDPDAFFKSPFQLRYSRDTMEATVLITNPPIFKVTEITETHSEVKGNVAWSIGSMISDWIRVDENGNRQVKKWHNDYVYLFVKRKGEWKLQMLFFHE